MEIIIGRNGNQKLPISDVTVSKQHCKVTSNHDGSFTIENLSPNGTKVNGVNIIRTTALLDCKIQLGPSFIATLGDLIGNITIKEKSPNREFDISHLRVIWEDYNSTNMKEAEHQRKLNITRTGLGIFTMCAMPTCFFLGPIGYALTGIGVIGNLYSFLGLKNSENAQKRQERQDAFDNAWICPNPDCGKTIPARNYNLLVRNYKSCPFCKCKYIEK